MRMKKAGLVWIVMVVLGVCTGWAQVQPGNGAAEEKPLPESIEASCVVKITADSSVFPLAIENVTFLVHSSGVGGRAIDEFLSTDRNKANPVHVIIVEELIGAGGNAAGAMVSPPPKVRPTTSRTTTATSRTSRTTRTPGTTSSRTTSYARGNYGGGYEEYGGEMYGEYGYGRALKPRTPTSPSRVMTYSTQSSAGVAERSLFFRLRVDFEEGFVENDVPKRAKEVLSATVEYLGIALERAFDDQKSAFKSQMDVVTAEVDRSEMELVSLQDYLRNLSGSRDLSRHVIMSEINVLRDELENLAMEQDQDDAFSKAITKQMLDSREKLAEKLAEDEIMRQLEQIVGINTEKLEFSKTLFKSGNISQAEIARVTEGLAIAKIEVARRREEISKSVVWKQEQSLKNTLAR